MIKLTEANDRYEVSIDGVHVGTIFKSSLEDKDAIERILNNVSNRVIEHIVSGSRRRGGSSKSSLAGDLFDICTLGLFKKW